MSTNSIKLSKGINLNGASMSLTLLSKDSKGEINHPIGHKKRKSTNKEEVDLRADVKSTETDQSRRRGKGLEKK